jgi:hypothetical protein
MSRFKPIASAHWEDFIGLNTTIATNLEELGYDG